MSIEYYYTWDQLRLVAKCRNKEGVIHLDRKTGTKRFVTLGIVWMTKEEITKSDQGTELCQEKKAIARSEPMI